MAFFDRYESCCNDAGVKTHSQALADLWGVSRGTISGWKKNGTAPNQEELVKMADYFHVSTDYLLERTDLKTDFSKGNMRILDLYAALDAEDRQKAESFIEFMLSNDKYQVIQHTQAGA